LISSGLVPAAAGGFNYMIEQPNRGKRSVGINLAHADGREIHDDAQVIANGYLPTVASDDGSPVALVANPVQFDETPPVLGRAPEHGQHTEEVLLEIGLTWDELAGHKESGAIL
jgi:crotonobetainyl-CoA:carnitine CoA-transferase CaiB-like acyl-CoA transferase